MKLLNAQPTLRSTDVEASLKFYEKLGFEKVFQNEDVHIVIQRDGVYLHLANYLFGSPCGCQIMVDDVDALFEEATRQGIESREGLQDHFWGNRDFSIDDNEGNIISFAQHIGEAPSEST